MILSLIILYPKVEITNQWSEEPTENEIYTENGYYALISMVFSDEEPEELNIIENELYSDDNIYFDGDYAQYLEGLSDEELDMVEKKLNKL